MCCGFVGDIVGGVVDAIGSVAEFVVDNALPIIETVALTYALGPAGLGMSQLTSTIVSRVAVTALNGGSIGDIVAAGLTPALPSIASSFGIEFNPSSFLSKPIVDALGGGTLAKIVGSAAGSAVMGGAVAAVTGGDIAKAATMAGLSGVVQQGLVKTWDTLKENLPVVDNLSKSISSTYNDLTSNPTYKTIQEMQTDLENRTNTYNQLLEKYQPIKQEYDTNLEQYNNASNSDGDSYNIDEANKYAAIINNTLAPQLNELTPQLNSAYADVQTGNQSFADYLKTNQADIDLINSQKSSLDSLSSQYNQFSNKIIADYSQSQIMDAIQKGDYESAANYQKSFDEAVKTLSEIDPSYKNESSLSSDNLNLLRSISNASTPDQKQALLDQAKLSPEFANIKSEYGQSPGYNQLPNYPESGADQTTPTTPTTTTPTTPTNTGSTGTTSLAGNLANAFQSAIKQGIVSNVAGRIINGPNAKKPIVRPPSKPKPAQHVDVSLLRPFTGTLPTQLQKPATGGLPTTPTTTTPTTPVTQENTQNVAQTPTQTQASGLTSVTQPQATKTKPAQHVDVSLLTPITNTSSLANLGLNLG